MDNRTVRHLRLAALGQDALLFCAAFTAGALVYFVGRLISIAGDAGSDVWTIGLSEDLILSGLIVGELFLVWNNGLRQGLRGHSIGKHRLGLAVVDARDHALTGAARGLLRGVVTAILLDLAAATIPIGLPTVLRRLTPESWHFGGAAYLALLLLLVPLLASTDRGFADRIIRTKVVRAVGAGSETSPGPPEGAGRARPHRRRWSARGGDLVHRLLRAAAEVPAPVLSASARQLAILSTSCILISRDIPAVRLP